MVRPKRRDARRASLRAIAPAVSGFHGLAFLRGGMIAAAPRAMDGIVVLAGVEGTIGGDTGGLVIGRDLVEQFRQHGRVAHIAGGEISGPYLQGLLVNFPSCLMKGAAPV